MKIFEGDFDKITAGEMMVDPFQPDHPRLLKVVDDFFYKNIKMVYVFDGTNYHWLANTKASGPSYFQSLDSAIIELRRELSS